MATIGKSLTNGAKIAIITLVIGGAIAVGKSAAVFGIIFISAAYMSYVLLAALFGFVFGSIGSWFAKKDDNETVIGDLGSAAYRARAAAGATDAAWRETNAAGQTVDTDPVAMAAAAMSHLTPEQIADLVAKMAAGAAGGKGGRAKS